MAARRNSGVLLLCALVLCALGGSDTATAGVGRIGAVARQVIEGLFAAPVSVSAPSDGDILSYASASGTWGAAAGGGVAADQAFDSILFDKANQDVTLRRTGTGDLTLSPSSGQVLFPDGQAATPSVGFTSRPATGIYLVAGQPRIGFVASGAVIIDMTTVNVAIAKPTTFPRAFEASTAGVGAPNVLVSGESFKVLSNEGSVATNYHTLPTAVAGLTHTFIATDASDLLRVTAAAGDTVEIAGAVSAVAGYAETLTAGGPLEAATFLAVDNTRWIAIDVRGEWSVDGVSATRQHAEYYVANANKVATAAITAGTPVEASSTATATAGEVSGFTVTTTGGGRATYDGAPTRVFAIAASVSMTSDTNGIVFLLYIAVNGAVLTDSEVRHKLILGADVSSVSVQTLATLTTGDYVEVYVDVTSGTPTFTAETLHVSVIPIGRN